MTFGDITTKKPAQIEWAFLLYGVSFITYERGQGLAFFCEYLFNLKDDMPFLGLSIPFLRNSGSCLLLHIGY